MHGTCGFSLMLQPLRVLSRREHNRAKMLFMRQANRGFGKRREKPIEQLPPPVIGTCRLCRLEEQVLKNSHYIPSALYWPKGLEFTTKDAVGKDGAHLKQHLLC